MTLDQQSTAVDVPAPATPAAPPPPLRLNLGSGPFTPPPDNDPRAFLKTYTHVDARQFEGVNVVHDLGTAPWPWADDSVDEAYASHFVEHLRGYRYSDDEPWAHLPRVVFANELYRVLKPGARVTIITPHWCSMRAYGDLTHQWPPVSEFWAHYLSREWRTQFAPHNDFYTCNFHIQWGHGMHQDLLPRADDFRQFALTWFREAAQDLHMTWTKVV